MVTLPRPGYATREPVGRTASGLTLGLPAGLRRVVSSVAVPSSEPIS